MSKRSPPVALAAMASSLRLFKWVALGLLILFALSGITSVAPGEVAIILRMGKLQGATAADQVKHPGLLFALPYPIDRVLRAPVRQEGEVVIEDAWKSLADQQSTDDTIDPLREGYCLTGDQNILQVRLLAKYKIDDPVAFLLNTDNPERVVRSSVLASLTQSIGGWSVDDALRMQTQGQQSQLVPQVVESARRRLAELRTGIAITAVEIKEIHPPRHVVAEFQKAQSAKIEKETMMREAEAFAARETPKAESERDRMIKEATAYDSDVKARASAEVSLFRQLHAENQRNPALVWDRLYMESIEEIMAGVGKLDFVAPHTRVLLSDSEQAR